MGFLLCFTRVYVPLGEERRKFLFRIFIFYALAVFEYSRGRILSSKKGKQCDKIVVI